jgi:hypothetical protein
VSAGHNPIVEIWTAIGSGSYTKLTLTSPTNYNDNNWTAPQGFHSYPRMGHYFAGGFTWDSSIPHSQLDCYLTTMYLGTGADLYAEAVSALSGLTS